MSGPARHCRTCKRATDTLTVEGDCKWCYREPPSFPGDDAPAAHEAESSTTAVLVPYTPEGGE